MQIIKSFGDGIGTAAGVAWPTFGLVFGLFALAASGFFSILLGSASIVIFLGVLLPTTYWSYKQYLKEKDALQRCVYDLENKTIELLFSYVAAVIEEYFLAHDIHEVSAAHSANLVAYIKSKIEHDTHYKKLFTAHPAAKLLQKLMTCENADGWLNQFANLYTQKVLQQDACQQFIAVKHLIHHIDTIVIDHHQSEFQSTLPRTTEMRIALSGFFSAFGSIAGCSAGVFGMLIGIGVFAGIGVIPIVGWVALAAAVIFGVSVGLICVSTARHKHHQEQNIHYYETIHQKLEPLVIKMKVSNKVKKRMQEQKTVTSTLASSNMNQYQSPNQIHKVRFDVSHVRRANSLWRDAAIPSQASVQAKSLGPRKV